MTPADFPRQDCSSYRELHARHWGMGFVHHSRAIFLSPNPNARFALYSKLPQLSNRDLGFRLEG
jgi:hypothetical protein